MELKYLELTELRELLDGKKISSVELAEDILSRIGEQDQKYNSYLTVTTDAALARRGRPML